MSCTTVLVGKKASYDGSTLIARNDDGSFDVKHLITVEKQPRKYKSVIAKLEIELPENPLRYTCVPNVDRTDGMWPAQGINSANVAMSATETLTSNALVLGADPYVSYKKPEKRGEKAVAGGIGEEDLVAIVLPYIKTAREGVLRLGALLEQYGTYEPNGIAFSDKDEVWWLETIGGHHWLARRLYDEECVIMPNQFGIDCFDFEDALGAGEMNLCSKDLLEFVKANHLDLNQDPLSNPRNIFGSHTDADHVYNTPRGWYMARYFMPTRYQWEGEGAEFTPESDNIPWSFVPERKITVEDIKYILGSHYQGTPYDPYSNGEFKGKYRSIGINRTGTMSVCQIRGYMPESKQALQWVCFGPVTFTALLPVYTMADRIPAYLSKVTTDVSTENFYWASRLIAALAEPHFFSTIPLIERYQAACANAAHRLINEYDAKGDDLNAANEALCAEIKQETVKALNAVTLEASKCMKNGYHRGDN